jgi:hypothetical protein
VEGRKDSEHASQSGLKCAAFVGHGWKHKSEFDGGVAGIGQNGGCRRDMLGEGRDLEDGRQTAHPGSDDCSAHDGSRKGAGDWNTKEARNCADRVHQ